MENQRKLKAMKVQNTKLSTSNDLLKLNDHCLLHIFSFLPIMDRIRIQRVCKRWREIGNLPWRDMKRLDFCKTTWTTRSQQFQLSEKMLQQVFQLCGGFLREIQISLDTNLRFGEITEQLERVFVVLLRESCPNVQILNLQDVKSHCKILEDFAKHFNGITDFSIESNRSRTDLGSCFRDEGTLARFLRRNGNLRSLRLCSVMLQGECFRYLPFQIEEIIIDQCHIDEIKLDGVTVLKLSNLKSITFTHNHCDNFNDIFEFITVQSNLKKLELASSINRRLFLQSITELHHLETLKLGGGLLSNDMLVSASENYKNLINISLFCAKVTDASVILVLSLPNLQYVKFLYMLSITDNVLLTEMPKLKSLECATCPRLQNNGFRAVMESSKNIETLRVNGCIMVSAANLIKDANQIIKNRNSNAKLELYLNGQKFVINGTP